MAWEWLPSGVAGVFGGFAGAWISGYLTEKGKNLASKEDIAGVTERAEKVLQASRLVLENLRQTHDLRMAAVDKRLEVHQEAFYRSREMPHFTHKKDPEKAPFLAECWSWWARHCLYLEPEASDAFVAALVAVDSHHFLLGEPGAGPNMEEVKANWAKITGLGNIIRKAVKLPPLQAELVKVDSVGRKVEGERGESSLAS